MDIPEIRDLHIHIPDVEIPDMDILEIPGCLRESQGPLVDSREAREAYVESQEPLVESQGPLVESQEA